MTKTAILFLSAWISVLYAEQKAMTIQQREFGKTKEGHSIPLYTLTNDKGHHISITPYGAIITSILVPDRQGKLGDVVLGYDRLEDYLRENPYFGCVAGRYANRIARGRFRIGEREYRLAQNNGPNHLHGGLAGFDKRLWKARELRGSDHVAIELSYLSPDGEEGYPGNLEVKVCYTWTNESSLRVDYEARTDKPTVCNLAQHSYFNLADGGASPILNHQLQIDADRFTPVDDTLIPTGKLADLTGTPLDFRTPIAVGRRINNDHPQLRIGLGYDHNYVLNGPSGKLRPVAALSDPKSGRRLTVSTTEPGLQFYSGNFLDGKIKGKGGIVYGRRHGLCLETQHFPDSPNRPEFPTTLLRPGETYRSTTVYTFTRE